MTSLAMNPLYAKSSKVAIWAATLMVFASIVFSAEADQAAIPAPPQPHPDSAEWHLRGTLKPFDPPPQSTPRPAAGHHASEVA